MLGTQIPSIQALVIPTFTYGTEIWGGNLNNSHSKVFEKGMKMHMMFHVFHDNLSYFVGQIWRTPHGIRHSQTRYRLPITARYVSPSSLVCKATSLSRHLMEHGFNTWHKSTTMWQTSLDLYHWTPMTNLAYDDIMEALSISQGLDRSLPPPQNVVCCI